jgi:hypothetical protein
MAGFFFEWPYCSVALEQHSSEKALNCHQLTLFGLTKKRIPIRLAASNSKNLGCLL